MLVPSLVIGMTPIECWTKYAAPSALCALIAECGRGGAVVRSLSASPESDMLPWSVTLIAGIVSIFRQARLLWYSVSGRDGASSGELSGSDHSSSSFSAFTDVFGV